MVILGSANMIIFVKFLKNKIKYFYCLSNKMLGVTTDISNDNSCKAKSHFVI